MAIKRDGHSNAFVLAGVLNRLPNDLLMAEVDAVKHPDGHAGFARAGIQVAGGADDVHGQQT